LPGPAPEPKIRAEMHASTHRPDTRPQAASASVLVEACVDALDAALAAERGGARRIELCGELLQGGVTPSAGLIGAVRDRVSIPVFVLVRPRTGDFLYDADELDVMRRDVAMAASLGADGVVLGALTAAGDIDVDAMRPLIDAARPMQVTFHRAFDFARVQAGALDALLALGVERVLTSGGAPSALEGVQALARLVRDAGERLTVLAGGSITASNAAEVARLSGVRELHVRGARRVESAMLHRRAGVTLARAQMPDDYERVAAGEKEIRQVVDVVK
jgi:copper homeostasis protein